MLTQRDIKPKAIEIISNKLYWMSANSLPKNEPRTFFFNVDNDLVYEPLRSDFGPLDIGKTVKYVKELEKLLDCPQFLGCKIYHHTSLDEAKRANAAFLMGAFQVIVLNKSAEEAWKPFKDVQSSFIPFRDALVGPCSYKCTVLDCLKGIEQAIKLGWFNIKTFDLKTYEHYGSVKNGDLHWIIPGKLLAFSGPSNVSKDADGYKRFTPEDYVPMLKKLGVKTIIRLNQKEYDEKRFTSSGLKHYDLNIPKYCPDDNMVEEFLKICEETEGAIAVHCKTGLGQAATMIACYAMKHHMFSAASIIAWTRLCKPGSILGRQQEFLVNQERKLKSPVQESIIFSDADTHNGQGQNQPYMTKPKKFSLEMLNKGSLSSKVSEDSNDSNCSKYSED